jgi:hypothetical protein
VFLADVFSSFHSRRVESACPPLPSLRLPISKCEVVFALPNFDFDPPSLPPSLIPFVALAVLWHLRSSSPLPLSPFHTFLRLVSSRSSQTIDDLCAVRVRATISPTILEFAPVRFCRTSSHQQTDSANRELEEELGTLRNEVNQLKEANQ